MLSAHRPGLVINAVVLWNTRYLDAAVARLRANVHDIKDEDVTRLSPLKDRHINFLGCYLSNITASDPARACAPSTTRTRPRSVTRRSSPCQPGAVAYPRRAAPRKSSTASPPRRLPTTPQAPPRHLSPGRARTDRAPGPPPEAKLAGPALVHWVGRHGMEPTLV
ncbi:Tn3 family transposase [Streptomyces sp. MSC1_001]|uniref:Tn3 family transposase n=1 Tax=Streptomyces sp. MSC1_001 TaxID=2909263 RepID=UPI0035B30B00